MADLTIITNNVPRDVIDAWELSPAEQAEFDYLDWRAIEQGEDSASFARYKGELLDLNDLEPGPGSCMPDAFAGWSAYRSESFFSGVLVRWVEVEGDWLVVMGRYYC